MLAIDRLAADQPLHAGILGRWKLLEDPSVKTMAVGFRHARLILCCAPAFIESTTMDELVGVVEHECNHVLLGHVFHDPAPNENRNARTVAEEVSANEWCSHPLPGDPILLASYPMLPENEDTETRYDRLKGIVPDVKVLTIDEHTTWAEIVASGQLGAAVVTACIAQAWGKLTPEQKSKLKLPQPIQKLIEQAVNSSGSSVIGAGTASVPWQKILRCYVGRSLMRRPVFGRVPRRFPELVGVIPATGRSGSKPKIMAVIDTSGSMTPAILAEIGSELALMSRTHTVIVVECDDQIRAVYPYRPIVGEVHGRGGTNFRPIFQSAFLRQHRPDLIVYLTDGHGKAPPEPPRIPVIWCITPHGRKPSFWGKEVRLCG